MDVVIGKVRGYAGDLGLEKGQCVAAERVIGIGTALDGDDAVERKRPDGGILVVDSLHDVGENVFYVLERRFAKGFGQVQDCVERGGAIACVSAVGAVFEEGIK